MQKKHRKHCLTALFDICPDQIVRFALHFLKCQMIKLVNKGCDIEFGINGENDNFGEDNEDDDDYNDDNDDDDDDDDPHLHLFESM